MSQDLERLTSSVAKYRLSRPGADADAMVNYDRLRLLKDSLLDQVMNASVAVTEALRFLTAAGDSDIEELADNPEERTAVGMLRACLHGDATKAGKLWPSVRASLSGQPILYVPLNRGGPPTEIAVVRSRQHLIQDLLYWLPRLGLLKETFQLLEQAREMELTPVGVGAITEFDDLFEVGCRSMVNALIDVGAAEDGSLVDSEADDWLVANLEDVMEPLLRSWLAHSRTLRLSVLEQVLTDEAWQSMENFIRGYGRDLFTHHAAQ